jgi:hypothetical protein
VRTRGFAAPAFAGCALVIRNRRLVYVRYAPVGTSSNEHGLGVRNGLGSRRWDSITRPDLGRLENLGEIASPRFVRKKAEDRARPSRAAYGKLERHFGRWHLRCCT